MKNKILIGIAVVIILFIALNPSPKSFYYYSGRDEDSRRTANFLVCSLYECPNGDYFGILGNFFMTKKGRGNLPPGVRTK